jgi:hypothetical protein
VIPIRLLPPHALVVGLSPLLDQRFLKALLDLRGRGLDVAVIELPVEPHLGAPATEVALLARRMWRLERETVRARLLQAGVGVAEWAESEPLEAVVAEVDAWRRRARLRVR